MVPVSHVDGFCGVQQPEQVAGSHSHRAEFPVPTQRLPSPHGASIPQLHSPVTVSQPFAAGAMHDLQLSP